MGDRDAKRRKFDDHNTRAKQFFQREEFGEAIAEWSLCIEQCPGDHIAYSNRSAAHLKNADAASALKDAEIVTKLSPAFAKGWHRMGAALDTMQKFSDAVGAYEKAVELDPTNMGYVDDFRRVKNLAAAGRGVADEATRKQYYLAQHQASAKASFDAGDFLAAVRIYTKAIGLDEKNHLLFSNRSAAFIKCGKFEEAIEDGRKCVLLCPSYAKGYARIGTGLLNLKRVQESRTAFEKGLVIDPTNTACLEGIALLGRTLAEERAKAEMWLLEKQDQREQYRRDAEAPEAAPLPINTGAQTVCFKCGLLGHESAQCVRAPMVDKGHATGYDYCKFCNKIGHLAKDCPDKKVQAPLSKSFSCKLCNMAGHMAQDCPHREAFGRK